MVLMLRAAGCPLTCPRAISCLSMLCFVKIRSLSWHVSSPVPEQKQRNKFLLKKESMKGTMDIHNQQKSMVLRVISTFTKMKIFIH